MNRVPIKKLNIINPSRDKESKILSPQALLRDEITTNGCGMSVVGFF